MKYAVTLMLLAGFARAADYPLTVTVVETDSIRTVSDGTSIRTKCTTDGDDTHCNSFAQNVTHIQLVQVIKASDGNTYAITCVDVDSLPRAFLRGFAHGLASSGSNGVVGCTVANGEYKARWDNGFLEIVRDKHGKKKETKFYVTIIEKPPLTPSASVLQQSALPSHGN